LWLDSGAMGFVRRKHQQPHASCCTLMDQVATTNRNGFDAQAMANIQQMRKVDFQIRLGQPLQTQDQRAFPEKHGGLLRLVLKLLFEAAWFEADQFKMGQRRKGCAYAKRWLVGCRVTGLGHESWLILSEEVAWELRTCSIRWLSSSANRVGGTGTTCPFRCLRSLA